MQVTFPHSALWQAVDFYLSGQSLDTQESISGVETVVPTMRGRWMATVNFAMKTEAQVLQWQGFLAQMQGRIGTTLVPVRSRFGTRDRDGHIVPFCETGGLAGAQTWEHFGFANSEIDRIEVASAVGLRGTQMDLRLIDSTGIRPGQFFSIGDRLYRVRQHWETSSFNHRITFDPPLRAPVASGTVLEVGRPVCLMRMISETEGVFDQSLDVLPRVRVSFAEAL